jgi:RNA polymerase sigma factor (sigma-70 family)
MQPSSTSLVPADRVAGSGTISRIRPRHAADAGTLERVLQAVDVPADARASLIEHLTRSIRGVARMHRLRPHDVDDVVQTTWLRLLEHHDRIRDPAALRAWLHTTARRESLRLLREGARVEPVGDDRLDARDAAPTAHERVEDRERAIALLGAIRTLPDRQRQLMGALLADAESSYTDLSRALEMPIGSIGPTRARCLQRLREDPRLSGVAAAA